MKVCALILMACEFSIMSALFTLWAINYYPRWEFCCIIYSVFGQYIAMFLSTKTAAFEELYNASQEGPDMLGVNMGGQLDQTTAVVYTQPGVYTQGMQPQQQVYYAQPD